MDDKKTIIPVSIFSEEYSLRQKRWKKQRGKSIAPEADLHEYDSILVELSEEQRAVLKEVAYGQGYVNFDKAVHNAIEYIGKKANVDVNTMTSEQLVNKIALVLRVKKDELQKDFLSETSIFK